MQRTRPSGQSWTPTTSHVLVRDSMPPDSSARRPWRETLPQSQLSQLRQESSVQIRSSASEQWHSERPATQQSLSRRSRRPVVSRFRSFRAKKRQDSAIWLSSQVFHLRKAQTLLSLTQAEEAQSSFMERAQSSSRDSQSTLVLSDSQRTT